MPVPWSPQQEEHVDALIAARPIESGLCADLARAILPVACAIDPAAAGRVIRARTGQTRYPCIRPRVAGLWWRHHVTVAVHGHGVDALTGPAGTPLASYLSTHFDNDAEDLYFDDRDPNLEDPCL